MKLARRRGIQQLIVRDAAPYKEGEPRSQFNVAYQMDAARRRPFRILFNAEEELRADKKPLERPFDPEIESTLSPAGLIKRQKHFHVFFSHGPAVGASFERG